jgi:hypothetical protein
LRQKTQLGIESRFVVALDSGAVRRFHLAIAAKADVLWAEFVVGTCDDALDCRHNEIGAGRTARQIVVDLDGAIERQNATL